MIQERLQIIYFNRIDLEFIEILANFGSLEDDVVPTSVQRVAECMPQSQGVQSPLAECGLYRSRYEHDACGVGLVAQIDGSASHEIVEQGLEILRRLEHRGAVGGDGNTGDGAGISLQLGTEFAKYIFPKLQDCSAGSYAVGMVFLDPRHRGELQDLLVSAVKTGQGTALRDLEFVAWRRVPIKANCIGCLARSSMPEIWQLAVRFTPFATRRECDAQLYFLRRKIEQALQKNGFTLEQFYFCSFSSSLIVYKGMFTAPQLEAFYPDLQCPDLCSAYALVHQRYSTNTSPQWHLAHPFRHVAHNGEINTIGHNLRSFAIREANFESPVFAESVRDLAPTLPKDCSDSAGFDGALEFLLHNGRSLPQVLSMMVPEPFGPGTLMPEELKDYYHYQSMLMEPWDGPAAIVATTGYEVTAILDRNGLRPARFTVTRDGRLILASEAGVLRLDPQNILQQGKLSPGKLLSLDLESGTLRFDRELKAELAGAKPYRIWLKQATRLEGLQSPCRAVDCRGLQGDATELACQLRSFVYSYEDLREILAPMAEDGTEPTGSMAGLQALSGLVRSHKDHPHQTVSSYFRQTFAQVTNPPIDPYREAAVMSLSGFIGKQGNLLREGEEHCQLLELPHPIFGPIDLQRLQEFSQRDTRFRLQRISLLVRAVDLEQDGLQQAIRGICYEAEAAVRKGFVILLLSDRGTDCEHAYIPSLLALGAVQQHLLCKCLRHQVSLGVEGGELFSVHHFATLMAYGANFLVPYIAYHALAELQHRKALQQEGTAEGLALAIENYIEAGKKGLLKVMSKMGISTMQSYQDSQLYEILGLGSEIVDLCFTGTAHPIGGKGFAEVQREMILLHASAWESKNLTKNNLQSSGSQRHRRHLKLQNIATSGRSRVEHRDDKGEEESQLISPLAIVYLQQAVRRNDAASFRKYSTEVNQAGKYGTLRGLLRIQSDRKPIAIAEVESAEHILPRFVSGAMSYGSLSKEAHEVIAIAMNRIGAKSNSGEGGEDPIRYQKLPNGDDRRSRIKQIASGRFGVNSYYLANADELQIKMAQGAKPGEGGQLPGKKVDEEIARVRNSTPGVTLISPPPHHDIYSIEDLAQLIYDLRSANPAAAISVKLVAKSGVGTVAAGVAKGKANSILISGHDGGTGASPLSSLMHAGSYWELGLAETQQSLRRNHLRDKVRIQCDGQLKTGRDVLIAGLLGAEEFGFGTSCLIALGCIMMRKCHTNSCPVGIATQDKRCRERFAGLPEHVENMMRFIAEELRGLMAEMGYRRFEDLVGRAELLQPDLGNVVLRENRIDLKPLLASVSNSISHDDIPHGDILHGKEDLPRRFLQAPDLSDPYTMEPELLRLCREALGSQFEKLWEEGAEGVAPFYRELAINNSHRTVGATISYHISKNWGMAGLPNKSIHFKFRGTAGQSFAAFGAHGLQLELEGESNDYLGKGLSGARIIVYPSQRPRPLSADLNPQEHDLIVGNVCLFGATAGSAYIAGQAGERFAVRNSGATAVVEGLGDHGCEYMTGGRIVVLGPTGINFAAGMSGGIAYIWDLDGEFPKRCNLQQVELSPLVQHGSELHWLQQKLQQHLEYTGSQVARELLATWEERQDQFVRVIPTEYRRILQAATPDPPAASLIKEEKKI